MTTGRGSLRGELREYGHGTIRDPRSRIAPGAVFLLRDDADVHARLPGHMQGASRDFHGKRWVIVLQAAAAGADRALPTVAVVPCTASHEGRASVWDLELPDGEPGFTKPNIVALVSCLQPMLKTDLVEWMGQLRPETLGRMLGVHARNLGMTPGDLRRLL